MTIGDRIKLKLKEQGITQNELARRANLSSSGLSTIVTGAYDPRIGNIKAIAAALGCTVCELLGESAGDEVTFEEKRIIEIYRQLSDAGKEYVRQQLAIASHIYKQSNIVSSVEEIGG